MQGLARKARPYPKMISMPIAAILLSVAVQAKACVIARSAEEKLNTSYAEEIFSAVAAVTIVDARYTREKIADMHPWSATAVIDSVLMGNYEPKTVTFRRGGGSAACENDFADGNSLPQAGERWVVYFWKDEERGQMVWITYPLAIASKADPVLGPSMEANPWKNRFWGKANR